MIPNNIILRNASVPTRLQIRLIQHQRLSTITPGLLGRAHFKRQKVEARKMIKAVKNRLRSCAPVCGKRCATEISCLSIHSELERLMLPTGDRSVKANCGNQPFNVTALL